MSDHSHETTHESGEAHGSMRDYVIGFVLSVILTAIPFWLVMARPLEGGITAALIVIFAAVQMVVHMIYFLHMSPKSEDGWTLTSLIFTLIIVTIMLAGSLWVMYHLNTNMMPMPDMSQLP
ncbi:cytochrome o ubiquinol oxidase subunit IV [Altericroceibacterium endophyticum]|uniref:Cytochrome bo(3) ubiquinol oxidase subunit 4 n=1 Tax=Altericroceibacterium endophyticum TaxID=1808508 RepID=A0A6I4T3Y4_9SPHN|nr:cytochrome o ubiquinol oxidase subunit IV [Altericroceibacterium endophyticum]MXO65617.1 cytochrome o ubiquinol oxidase subunit IV [Altericroceibacterium endophyticum]